MLRHEKYWLPLARNAKFWVACTSQIDAAFKNLRRAMEMTMIWTRQTWPEQMQRLNHVMSHTMLCKPWGANEMAHQKKRIHFPFLILAGGKTLRSTNILIYKLRWSITKYYYHKQATTTENLRRSLWDVPQNPLQNKPSAKIPSKLQVCK